MGYHEICLYKIIIGLSIIMQPPLSSVDNNNENKKRLSSKEILSPELQTKWIDILNNHKWIKKSETNV